MIIHYHVFLISKITLHCVGLQKYNTMPKDQVNKGHYFKCAILSIHIVFINVFSVTN